MAIHNIHLIPDSSNYPISEQNKEQYIQALANLGQRKGMKGDGIKLSSVQFGDIFDDSSKSISYEDYIGVIRYTPNNNKDQIVCSFNSLSRDDFENYKFNNTDDEIHHEYDNINNILNITKSFSFDLLINNIGEICKPSVIINDDKRFTSLLYQRILNSKDSDRYNIELSYNSYDVENNRLLYTIKLFFIDSDSVNESTDRFCMFVVEYSGSEKKYLLSCWIIDVDENNRNLFENYLSKEKIDQQEYSDINQNYTLDDYTSIFEGSQYNIFNYVKTEGVCILSDIELRYNDEIANGFSIVNDNGPNSYNNIMSTYNDLADTYGITLRERITEYLSNETTILYRRLREYYLKEKYTLDRKTFVSFLFYSLYKQIFDNTNASLMDIIEDNTSYYMYIPFTYKLTYYCNENNEFTLYQSDDIFVTFLNNINDSAISDVVNNNIILAYGEFDNKISAYNINGTYNDELGSIDYIYVKQLYTLPYIDSKTGKWKVNDILTNFKSYVYSDVDQSIIIVNNTFSEGKINYNIINNIPESLSNIFNNDNNWEYSTYSVSQSIFDTGAEYSTIQIQIPCKVPKIDSELYTNLLSNTLLFLLTDIKSYIDDDTKNADSEYDASNKDILKRYVEGDSDIVLSTMWKLGDLKHEDDDSYYIFECINNENGNAFDISKIFSSRIFDIRSKNDQKNVFSTIALNAKAENAKQFIDTIAPIFVAYSLSGQKYVNVYKRYANSNNGISLNNDLIMAIKCDDSYINSGRISYVETLNDDRKIKYISLNDNGIISNNVNNVIENVTTNSLYEYHVAQNSGASSSLDTINYSQITDIERTNLNTNTDQIAAVLIDNSENSYTNSLNSTYSSTLIYDEHVFNNNVPMIDLKELIQLNSNTLNRLNILTLGRDNNSNNSDGKLYNSFIGSPLIIKNNNSFENKILTLGIYNGTGTLSATTDPKEILQITSTSENINVGNSTLCESQNYNKFAKQKLFNINFENIVISSDNIDFKVKKYDNVIYAGNYGDNIYAINDYTNMSVINNNDVASSSLFLMTKTIKPISLSCNYYSKLGGCVDSSNNVDHTYLAFFDMFNKIYYSTVNNPYAAAYGSLDYYNDFDINYDNIRDEGRYDYTDILSDLYNFNRIANIKNLITQSEENSQNRFSLNYANADIKSFFIEIPHPGKLPENAYNVVGNGNYIYKMMFNDSNITKLIEEYNKFEKLYIFRLSDYLYRQYGFDISSDEEYTISEKYSFDSRIFRIKLSNEFETYSYFIIYTEDEVEIKETEIGTETIKIIKPIHDITITARSAGSNKQSLNFFIK